MGNEVFVTRWWPWPLIHHGLRIIQMQHASTLLPYLHIVHFLPTPIVPHFYSSLLWWKLTVLYLLAYVYIMSNLILYLSRTRHMHLFPCHQPELCWRPQTMQFLKFIIKSHPLWPLIYGTQLLLLMAIFERVCNIFYWNLYF